MKFVTVLSVFFFSLVSQAVVLKCPVAGDKYDRIYIDPDKILISVRQDGSERQLVTADSVYSLSAYAIWHDRTNECLFQKTTLENASTQYNFFCGDDVRSNLSLNLDRTQTSGSLQTILTVPHMPTDEQYLRFQDCQRIKGE